VKVTHPFHPLAGQEFDFAFRRCNWGEDRVFVFTPGGGVRGFPAGWTDAASADPFVVVAAGRSAFRVEDLLALAGLLERLRPED
jgi:hypothetical protein